PNSFSGANRRPEDLTYPVGAAQYLRQVAFHGNVMTSYGDGSYLIWQLWPAVKVAMDSRGDVAYSFQPMHENYRFYGGEQGWIQTLDRYPTDIALVPVSLAISDDMAAAPGWRRIYRDDGYALYARPGLQLPVVDRTGQALTGRFP